MQTNKETQQTSIGHEHFAIPPDVLERTELQDLLERYQHHNKHHTHFLTSPSEAITQANNNSTLEKTTPWRELYQAALSLTATDFKKSTDRQELYRETERLLTFGYGISDPAGDRINDFRKKLGQHYLPWVSTAAFLIENLKNEGQTEKANFFSAILKPHLEVSEELRKLADQQKEDLEQSNIDQFPAYSLLGLKNSANNILSE